MNAVRTNFALRIATVTVAFFAWLVLSNHCALAEMLAVKTAPVSTDDHGCCNHHPAPPKDEKPRPPIQQGCCKSLTVVVPGGAKMPVASSLEIVALPVEWLVVLTLALPEENRAAPDTGPPPARHRTFPVSSNSFCTGACVRTLRLLPRSGMATAIGGSTSTCRHAPPRPCGRGVSA